MLHILPGTKTQKKSDKNRNIDYRIKGKEKKISFTQKEVLGKSAFINTLYYNIL